MKQKLTETKDTSATELWRTNENLKTAWRGLKQLAELELESLSVDTPPGTPENSELISKWVIEVYDDKVQFRRMGDGVVLEGYPPVTPAQATVYASAIVNGFQPPRDIRLCDKPTDGKYPDIYKEVTPDEQ